MKKLTKDLKNHDYFLEAYTAGVSASAVLIKGATVTTPIYARIPLFRKGSPKERRPVVERPRAGSKKSMTISGPYSGYSKKGGQQDHNLQSHSTSYNTYCTT